MFRLKKGKEGFTVVEGPLEGQSFKPGQLYSEVPPSEAAKFEEDTAVPVKSEVSRPARTGKKGLGDVALETGEVRS